MSGSESAGQLPGAGDNGPAPRSGGRPGRGAAAAPYRSHLRIYEPASVLRLSGRTPHPVDPAGESVGALRRLVATPPVLAPPADDSAYLLTAGEQEFWCPVDERHRCWEALRRARTDGGDLLTLCFGSTQLAEAETAYEKWRVGRPFAVPHVLTSAWHVPLRWFVAFDPAEKRVTEGPEPSVVYRTTMVAARRRLSKAHSLLRRKAPDDRLTEAVRDLGTWINEFHPRGIVELDHAGLITLLGFPRVRRDDSVAQIATVVAALDQGREAEAWAAYRVVLDRWRRVQQLSRAS